MKKNKLYLLMVFILLTMSLFTACKKTSSDNNTDTLLSVSTESESEEQTTLSENETEMQTATEDVETDSQTMSEEPAPDMEIIDETELELDEGTAGGVL